MQTVYRKYKNFTLLIALLCLVSSSIFFTACKDDDDNEDDGTIVLNSYGPMPIARGAELRFIGKNLDKVTSIMLPGEIEIPASAFGTKTSTLITITVPQNAVEGMVVVKTPQGDITTKTPMGFSEPISITSFAPASLKADSVLTITGDYLNLVKQVIFTDRITVDVADFISQTRNQLKLKIPATAQTGKIAVSNGAEDPIIVYSTEALNVILPAITAISPNPVKAGTNLTITGTNLDLVKTVALGGNQNVTSFVSQSATELVLSVPATTQDDTLRVIPASGVKVKSASKLTMVVPTVTVTPTAVKNGDEITVTGTNLDLINKVVFGGDKIGTIKSGGTATQIMVTIPNDAVTGVVKFGTQANKEVNGPDLTLIDPAITEIVPTTTKAKTDITITGTNLDLVVDVLFVGGVKGAIAAGRTESQLVVTVPVGAKDGKVTLVTKNGSQVQSSSSLTILANLPTITSFTELRGEPGKKITLNGTNMLLIQELIFPGNVKATAYGEKTDTKVEVYVPKTVTIGYGRITLLTYEGEEGISPELFFGATEPIVDPALMINNFEVINGHDLTWDNWGGAVALGKDPNLALSGNYMVGTKSALNGWSWIWGCNHAQLPKVSVTKADHVLKMDVNITKKMISSNFSFTMKLGGTDVGIGQLGMKQPDGSYLTPGWITMTFNLSNVAALPAVIPASGDWGMTVWTADPIDITGLYIDNIRFEKVN